MANALNTIPPRTLGIIPENITLDKNKVSGKYASFSASTAVYLK
jgi:hypothetical protein